MATTLINAKNTLAMRFLYSTDPRTITVQHAHRRRAAGSSRNTTQLLQHERGAEADHHCVEYAGERSARVLSAPVHASVRRLLPAGWTPQNLGITPIVPSQTQGPAISFLINGFGAGGFLEPAVQPHQSIPICRIRSPGRTEDTPFAPALKSKRPNGTSISPAWNAAGCSSEASPTCWPPTIPATSSSACSAYPAVLRAAGGIIHAYRETNMNSFVQDDWKVSSKLTVNLGVRWEYDGTFGEKYGNLTNTWISQLAPNSAGADFGARSAGQLRRLGHGGQLPDSLSATARRRSGEHERNRRHPRPSAALQLRTARSDLRTKSIDKLVLRGGAGHLLRPHRRRSLRPRGGTGQPLRHYTRLQRLRGRALYHPESVPRTCLWASSCNAGPIRRR